MGQIHNSVGGSVVEGARVQCRLARRQLKTNAALQGCVDCGGIHGSSQSGNGTGLGDIQGATRSGVGKISPRARLRNVTKSHSSGSHRRSGAIRTANPATQGSDGHARGGDQPYAHLA